MGNLVEQDRDENEGTQKKCTNLAKMTDLDAKARGNREAVGGKVDSKGVDDLGVSWLLNREGERGRRFL